MGEFEWGSMILSRYPIKAETIALHDRSAIKSQINIKRKTLHLDIIHHSPSLSEDQKIKSIKPVLKIIKKPYILTGDFNALTLGDNYNKEELVNGFKTLTEDADNIVAELLKGKFIEYLKKMSLKDAFEKNKRQATIPTKRYKTGSSDVRLDYFYISKDIKVIDAYVLKNELTEKASDHYPIVGIFEI